MKDDRLPPSLLTKRQERQFGPRPIPGDRDRRITATVRYDDRCGNGHNTFSITADIKLGTEWDGGGCCHEEIAKAFPELAPLIKWHLVSSDGPMHYISNTLYQAGDKDYRGLRKGERRQLRNGRTGHPVWRPVVRNEAGEEVTISGGGSDWINAAECPAEKLTAAWEPVWIIGEGKARELDHARASAVWPDAADEQLMADNLEEVLRARLPQLMLDFKAAVESLGFTY